MPQSALLLAAVLAVASCRAQRTVPYGVRPDGRGVTSLAADGTKAVALFFVGSDCPVSNRTFPEMKRLREEFVGRGVRIWYIYPNEGELAAEVQKHQAAYDPGGDVLLDRSGRLVAMTGAKVTPEIAVLVPEGSAWRSVYTGRIDDRYVHIGLERPSPTARFGDRVLSAVLSGGPVETATGAPVGCAIVQDKAMQHGAKAVR